MLYLKWGVYTDNALFRIVILLRLKNSTGVLLYILFFMYIIYLLI